MSDLDPKIDPPAISDDETVPESTDVISDPVEPDSEPAVVDVSNATPIDAVFESLPAESVAEPAPVAEATSDVAIPSVEEEPFAPQPVVLEASEAEVFEDAAVVADSSVDVSAEVEAPAVEVAPAPVEPYTGFVLPDQGFDYLKPSPLDLPPLPDIPSPSFVPPPTSYTPPAVAQPTPPTPYAPPATGYAQPPASGYTPGAPVPGYPSASYPPPAASYTPPSSAYTPGATTGYQPPDPKIYEPYIPQQSYQTPPGVGQQLQPYAQPGKPESLTWGSAAHWGSLLADICTPIIGSIIFPAVVSSSKAQDPFVKQNATEALNFSITMSIGLVISLLLTFVVIGFAGLITIPILVLVFRIQAAIAASRGALYRYPINIRFIK